MTAADALHGAAELLGQWGHNPNAHDGEGSTLTGYTLIGAVREAATRDTVAAGVPADRRVLARWVRIRTAVECLLVVLGYDPDAQASAVGARLIVDAGKGQATPWAVAVCEQAADHAAATALVRGPAAITGKTGEHPSA